MSRRTLSLLLAGAAIVLASRGGGANSTGSSTSEPRQTRGSLAAYLATVDAHTFVFEDAYLSTLVAAIPDRDFDELPDTQDRQRDAIIAWRIAVEALAARQGTELPADLKAAGRGEIAPSPEGS